MQDRNLKTIDQHQLQTFKDAVVLFQALADSAPVLIWMADAEGRRNFFNRRWLDFTGRELEQETGEWVGSLHEHDRNEYLSGQRGFFQRKEEYSLRYRLRRSDGEFRWIQERGSPFYLPSGEFAGYIGSGSDVTEDVSAIDGLERQNFLIRTIADNATVGLFLLDENYRINFMNQAAEAMTGYEQSEVLGRRLHDVIHHRHTDGSPFPAQDCEFEICFARDRKVKDLELDYVKKNGEFFPAVCSASPLLERGLPAGAVVEIRDITRQREAERALKTSEEIFKTLIEKSSDVILLVDGQGSARYVSPSVTRILGYQPEDLYGRGLEFVHPADLGRVKDQLALLTEGGVTEELAEVRVRHADGTWRWVEAAAANLLGDPNIRSVLVSFRDVTKRKSAEEQARYQLFHDPLTDLPNRRYFTEHLDQLLQEAPDKLRGVVLLDLDRFKLINESLGHALGDRVIQEAALRLGGCLEEGDMLARLGGDEFGIVLAGLIRQEESGRICSRIMEALKPAMRIGSQDLFITPSIGISIYPFDGPDAVSLMKNADSALYRAKEQGRNNFQYYSPSMNATKFQQLAMESTLRKALENREFVVYYQPQVDLETGRILQVEALVRWIHPELGLTFPNEFIHIAETTGLIKPIGEWVLRQACLDLKEWDEQGLEVGLAVNLSFSQLRQRFLVRNLRRILEDTGFPPGRLELELTESILMGNSHAVYNILSELKKDGITFAVDDLNTGYSSLNYVKHFPIDVLKIDKSFTKGVPGREKDTAIANAVIHLARSLNMAVVAEGVERPEQSEFLKRQGCHRAQGYLFSPPVTAREMQRLLSSQPALSPDSPESSRA